MRDIGSLVATGCDRHPPEIPGLGMGVPRVPDPTMWTIRNQVNPSIRPGTLRPVGISHQALCWWARGQLKEDAIIITHLITDPCYAGATHNCGAPVITTSF